ncbi:hypothetical protein Vi05172_g9342 [Venturia inaequalis]|nr:hypothetical protein Vi05172_g9342 [Venturia inaequalis]
MSTPTPTPTPTTPLLSLPIEIRHSILLQTHSLDANTLNTLNTLLSQLNSAHRRKKQFAIAHLRCCELSNKVPALWAEEALEIKLVQQERLAGTAKKSVMLVCRQLAQDMEYVTAIWTKEIEGYKRYRQTIREFWWNWRCGVCCICMANGVEASDCSSIVGKFHDEDGEED